MVTGPPSVRWTRTLADPIAGVEAIPGGVLAEGDGRVRALDATDGSPSWTVDADRVAAVVDGLVHLVAGRTLVAVDAATGVERWRYDAPARFFHERVAVDRVLLAAGPPDPSFDGTTLVGLDASTGARRWRTRRSGTATASPGHAGVLVTTVGGDSDDAVACLDPADGATRWVRRVDAPVTWASTVPIAAAARPETTDAGNASDDGSSVVLADLRDGLVALDGGSGEVRWFVRGRDLTPPVVDPVVGVVAVGDRGRDRLVALALETGAVRWSLPDGDVRRLLAVDGAVYAAGWDGTVRALGGVDGASRWTFDAGAATARLAPFDDLLCLRTDDGRAHAVERDRGRVRWSIGPDRPTTVVERVGEVLLAVGPDGGADLLSPATGEAVWRSGASSYANGPEGLYLAGDRAVEALSPDRTRADEGSQADSSS